MQAFTTSDRMTEYLHLETAVSTAAKSNSEQPGRSVSSAEKDGSSYVTTIPTLLRPRPHSATGSCRIKDTDGSGYTTARKFDTTQMLGTAAPSSTLLCKAMSACAVQERPRFADGHPAVSDTRNSRTTAFRFSQVSCHAVKAADSKES